MTFREQPASQASKLDQPGSELPTRPGTALAAEEALVHAERSLAEAESKVLELSRQSADQRKQFAERENLISNYQRALRRAEMDRKNLQDALDHSNALVTRLRSSVSWRVTLPIRSAARTATRVVKSMRERIRALRKALQVRESDARLIAKSGLFDRDYYLREYPEVARSGLDPIVHFLTTGAKEGKNPSPYFDTVYYARQMDGLRRHQ